MDRHELQCGACCTEQPRRVWRHPALCVVIVMTLNATIACAETRYGSQPRLFGRLMLGPLAAWLTHRRLAALAFGSACWFLSGYLFCIAVWI